MSEEYNAGGGTSTPECKSDVILTVRKPPPNRSINKVY
jgi:hypothetical protein